MFKRYCIQVFIVLMLPAGATAQSLTLSSGGGTSGTNTYALEGGQITFEDDRVRFAATGTVVSKFMDYGVSPDLSVVTFLSGNGGESRALILDSRGDTLSSYSITELSPGDPSLAVYPSNTGAVLVRDNIAGFSFYDSFGNIITHVSSSTQSEGGEAISEVVMDPAALTVVIYNPQIKRSGGLGSRAQILDASGGLESIYSGTGRIIKDAVVSDDGQFIVLLTGSEGSDDEVVIMDRFGNELNVITIDEDLKGAVLSAGAEYITLFSESRALVFSTLDGERLGSTSFRSPVVTANYFPGDDVLLAMTGEGSPSAGIVDNIDFHVIHLSRRQVAREHFDSAIGFNESIKYGLTRTGNNRYRLEGAGTQVVIEAGF